MIDDLLANQCGVLTRSQALALGLTPSAIRSRLHSGRWQHAHRSTYFGFNGPVPRNSRIWAAVLACGHAAAASHYTAAELWGIDRWARPRIHITIPNTRRIAPLDGVVVHRSPHLSKAMHPVATPRRTRVEHTVTDLIALARTPDEVVDLLTASCAMRLTTADRLSAVIAGRTTLKWHAVATAALDDARDGCQSVLEVAYLRRVERAHRLPRGRRQAPGQHINGSRVYRDVLYDEEGLIIELDGEAAHPAAEQRNHLKRDNSGVLTGAVALHFGWNDIFLEPCATASQVAAVLIARGWTGRPQRCGPKCSMVERW